MDGSVSRGCVESEVVLAEEHPLSTGQSEPEPLAYEAADDGDDNFNMGRGVTCGSIIQVVVERVNRKLMPFY